MRIAYFNDGLCRMLGCTREEYEKLTEKQGVITAVHADDVPRLQAQIKRMIVDGTPVDCTYRLKSAKGGYMWINLRTGSVEKHGDTLMANAVLYDVTEQRAAAEAARIHEEEMRIAMSQMGKVILEYDPVSRTISGPTAYSSLYGMSDVRKNVPDSMLQSGVIAESSLEAYSAFFAAILRGDKLGAGEYLLKQADGSLHWEHAEFSTIFDSEGKPAKTIISVEDTTQQHLQYELEQNRPTLARENLLVHALFNLTSGETLDYAYADATPVPPQERTAFAHDANLDELIINAQERQRYRELNDPAALLERFENGETELSIDYRRRLPAGDVRWVRNLLRLLRKPGSSDVLLFEYCYDIEEEKTSELMYSSLINQSYDYVARINGVTRGFVIMTNSDVEYGLPPKSGNDIDAAAQKIVYENVHPDDREFTLKNTCLQGMRDNLAERDRFQFSFRLLRPDGTVRYKRITEYYLDRERELIILIREDVSAFVLEELHKNELLSAALAASKQAGEAKSRFLSHMSHELRTPMNAIIGLSALSATELDDPRAMEDSIGKIGLSARYLLSLINDILEMSRIESGKVTLAEAPFDFEQFIAEVNSIIFAQAEAKGLDYDAIVNSYTEPSYVGDVTKLQEILINVLGNAVKFTPAGGKVTLSIEQLRCTKQRATLRFTVTDTGIGIDEAFLPNLFDPFAQEQGPVTTASTGTGLGLAITKSLVEMMNGHVSVKSIKNVGSVFTIDVQLGISEQSRQYLDMLAAMNLERLRALVVDDDVTVCRSTEGILKAMGIKAEWVDSGLRAVERVQAAYEQKQNYDTIFIDWKMPDMDGIETTRNIRRIVGPDVTIVIMTAHDWKLIEAEAREAGVDMFMEKPLFQSSVVRAFEAVFMQGREKITPAPSPYPDFTGKRILLVEDHPLNVEVARRILEKVHAEVVIANNGLEALESFTTAPQGYFDAILMDIRMPVMDGLTATKSIRNLRKAGSRDIPIIAMTANAFDDDVELSLSSGMNAHLTKPIEPRVLFATLKRLMKD